MKKTILTTLAALILLAPAAQADGPTLDRTLDWLERKIEAMASHRRERTDRGYTTSFRYALEQNGSCEITVVSTERRICHRTGCEPYTQIDRYRVHLADLDLGSTRLVDGYDAKFVRLRGYAGPAVIRWTSEDRPGVTLVPVTLIGFRAADDDVAGRVLSGVRHAIELCQAAEPF